MYVKGLCPVQDLRRRGFVFEAINIFLILLLGTNAKYKIIEKSVFESQMNFLRPQIKFSHQNYTPWVRKLKKVQAKKTRVKSNKSISRNFCLTKFHFLQFQKLPKINFWTGKNFKTAKNAISRKNCFLFIWCHKFFCLDFFKFSGLLCAGWFRTKSLT